MVDTQPPRPPLVGVPWPVSPGEVVPRWSTESDLVCDIWSTDARMAREHARQAAAIAELARRRAVERGADPLGRGPDAAAVRPLALAH
ncbi:hypothetical protein, partial [Blastococcus sp. SYSU D00820]